MAVLRQLHDPDLYSPCELDLKDDAESRAYWLDLFRWHLDAVLVPLIREEYPDADDAQIEALRSDYLDPFRDIEEHPENHEQIDVLLFTHLRANALARHGFPDPFRGIKQRENDAALELLPGLLHELDTARADRQLELLLQGVMAGNIFDLGSKATVERHQNGQTAFRETRATQAPRPWFIDDGEAWAIRWRLRGYRHVVYFVDNAGSDILLGCLPLARWMLGRAARVTLAANSTPSLNDVTAEELVPLLAQVAQLDSVIGRGLETGALRVAQTGSGSPLLDLSDLHAGFVSTAANADLLILHGMGRGIESNFNADFSCDVLHSAVIKDEAAARHIGAQLYDCVFRFRPPA